MTISLKKKFPFKSKTIIIGDIIKTLFHFRPGQDAEDFLPSPFASGRGIFVEGIE